MLTPEQTIIRRQDKDIKEMRLENERLTKKLKDIKIGVVELIRTIAYDMNYLSRKRMLEMANKLEQDV